MSSLIVLVGRGRLESNGGMARVGGGRGGPCGTGQEEGGRRRFRSATGGQQLGDEAGGAVLSYNRNIVDDQVLGTNELDRLLGDEVVSQHLHDMAVGRQRDGRAEAVVGSGWKHLAVIGRQSGGASRVGAVNRTDGLAVIATGARPKREISASGETTGGWPGLATRRQFARFDATMRRPLMAAFAAAPASNLTDAPPSHSLSAFFLASSADGRLYVNESAVCLPRSWTARRSQLRPAPHPIARFGAK
jgi:hypothetical protein